MHRSDYMLNHEINDDEEENLSLKQIEINTMAAGAAGLSGKVSQIHR